LIIIIKFNLVNSQRSISTIGGWPRVALYWVTSGEETNEKFVETVLKFNAALGRLAEERYVDKEELLSKETPEPVVG